MIEQNVRDEIRQLRAKGMTYREICQEIGREVSKGSLSYICKDVVLPDEYFIRYKSILQENAKLAREKALIANKRILQTRLDTIQNRAQSVAASSSQIDHAKTCLAMLYIAEGSKYRSYRGLAMGSSDPDILRMFISLLEHCYHKKHSDFHARIQHRDDQNEQDLQAYWANELNLLPDAFYSSYVDKRTIGRPTRRMDYKGVCVVSCSGADIQLELDAIARIYGQKIWGISSVG